MSRFSNDDIDENTSIQDLIFCAIDFETTGLRGTDEIIEIGAVKIKNFQIIAEYRTLVQPIDGIIPFRVTEQTGINNDDVSGAPTIDEIKEEFLNFINGTILIEHSKSGFDRRRLEDNFDVDDITYYFNSLELLTKMRDATISNRSLENSCKFFNIPLEHPHRALDDARGCGLLFCELLKRFNIQTFNELIDLIG